MPVIQIHPAGRRVISSASFWCITCGGRVIGWASGYRAALARAARFQQEAGGAG